VSLTVLSVAYPLAPVGPDAVGGAEQVVAQLDRALTDAGHTSIVIAREDSTLAGDLVAIPRYDGTVDDGIRKAAQNHTRAAIQKALERWNIDVVHMHGIDFREYLPAQEIAALVTLHLPATWYPPEVFALPRPNTYLNCVSNAQQQQCPRVKGLLPAIENGVPLDAFELQFEKGHYALALGRVCPEKGFHLSLDAARAAGIRLVLGGEVYKYESHQSYYESEIVPRLDAHRQFVGPLALERKRELLASARCLLVASQVPETSSLVAMEAMACGTPVIAFPSGALADIVQHGITGFLVNSVQEMAEAIGRVSTIDPQACRRSAEERFSMQRMLAGYIGVYERLSHCSSAIVVPSLRTEMVQSFQGLQMIEDDYRRLFEACGEATPFSSPDWLLPWWQHLGSGEIRTISVRRGGKLVALAPLMSDGGAVRFIGTGDTDYMDVLATDDAAAAALWEGVLTATEGSTLSLEELREDSIALRTMPDELRSRLVDGCACPVIGLETLQLPAKLLKNIRGQLRRLPEAKFSIATESTVEEFINSLLRLHSARWNAAGGQGVLSAESVRCFHREAVPRLLRAGILRMHGLRSQGQLCAVLYCLARGGRAYYYLGGFDPGLSSYGPGSILLHHAIDFARQGGDREFDMLRGAESYKYRWGAQNRTSRNVVSLGAKNTDRRNGVSTANAARSMA
jgi:CelD/BcsL family acetyltransferase involved in cellulose biosynthesis/glycosyltransferase involved in cell wall biosynthesis